MSSDTKPWVIIVGAGPSGLLLGLLLAKRGIPVQLVDLTYELDKNPRATHYGPPAMYELNRAGVVGEMREQGFLPNSVCWRKLDGTYLTGVDMNVMGDYPDRMVCLPLNRLGKIIYDHLQRQPSATVNWGYKVVSLGQDEEKAWVNVETPEGPKKLEAKYIVGCDGANSQVRRSLFGDWEFPGKTWENQIVATNTYYNFEPYKWLDSNFIIHPEHFFMAARIGTDGLWRITYGEKPGLTTEQLRERLPMKFKTFLPGHPEPDQYNVVNFSPYKIHQRLATKMRVGRFCLAADAAHLCNPFGGMGLTGGIVDVGGLYDCLVGIYDGLADDSILDKYSEIRMKKYNEIINPISSDNILRLFDQDPDTAMEKDQFLQMLKRAETDLEFAKEMQNGANALMHDFTQYYNSKKSSTAATAGEKVGAVASEVPLPQAVATGGVN